MDATKFPPLPAPVTLNSIMSRHVPRDGGDRRITIRIQNVGGLSAHQTVDAERADFGFDWEGHQLVITPAVPLTTLTAEQLADIATSVRGGQSWHAYQVHKRYHEKEKALTAERDALAQRVKELEAAASAVIHARSQLGWCTEADDAIAALYGAMQQAGKAEGGV